LNAFFATEKTVTFPNITDILALSIKQCTPLVAANVNESRPLPPGGLVRFGDPKNNRGDNNRSGGNKRGGN
jgi:hypothetical protein